MRPELKALAEIRMIAARAVRATDDAYDAACLRLINDNLPENIEELVEQGATVPFTLDELYMPRVWDCPASPTSHCVYNPASDPGDCDSCLYCNDPRERK
jgi:hypothetical protein